MVIHLRPYQRLALYHLRRSMEAGAWRQYLDLPTGTGKSTLAAAFAAQRLGQTPGRVLALVHRQDLALQLAETFRQEELEVGLLMEDSHTLHTPVVVATVQSLMPEATQALLTADAMPILTVLIDEAHHAVPGSAYERVPEHLWIERRYLPLRQQVALVQEATAGLFREVFAGKAAAWLKEPATEKQLETLGHHRGHLPEQARAAGWTKREASEAIAFYQLRRVLFQAPDE